MTEVEIMNKFGLCAAWFSHIDLIAVISVAKFNHFLLEI